MPFVCAYEGNSTHRFLPIMIGRLMLSLRKAADPSNTAWSLTNTTSPSNRERPTSEFSRSVQFAPRSEGSIITLHRVRKSSWVQIEINT